MRGEDIKILLLKRNYEIIIHIFPKFCNFNAFFRA